MRYSVSSTFLTKNVSSSEIGNSNSIFYLTSLRVRAMGRTCPVVMTLLHGHSSLTYFFVKFGFLLINVKTLVVFSSLDFA